MNQRVLDNRYELQELIGGGGMAAGEAFLALAGPIGWAFAGASLITSTIFMWKGLSDKKRLEDVFTTISQRDVTSSLQKSVKIISIDSHFMIDRSQVVSLTNVIRNKRSIVHKVIVTDNRTVAAESRQNERGYNPTTILTCRAMPQNTTGTIIMR